MSPFKTAPIVLLGRTGGNGKDHTLVWQMTDGACSIDGIPIEPVSTPTVYYKEDGRVKKRSITNSGVWSVFLEERHPTEDEFKRAFEELERDGHK
jgi:hypothetical protein